MLPPDPLNLGRTVWQLHGTTAKDVLCVVRETSHGWELMVIHADEALMTEYFSDANGAMTRATLIKNTLIEKGWVQVPVAEHDSVG